MNPVRDALINKLRDDPTLSGMVSGVYNKVAPSGAETPFLIVQKMSGVAIWAMQGPSLDDDKWMVKAVGGAAESEDINEYCRTFLTDVTLEIEGKHHQYLRYESDIDFAEVTQGERYDHVGSIYSLYSEKEG